MATQTRPWAERIKAAWADLRAGGVAPEGAAADPRLRTAALEMDLRDRDEEIRRLRQEYERLREQAERQQGWRPCSPSWLPCRLWPGKAGPCGPRMSSSYSARSSKCWPGPG